MHSLGRAGACARFADGEVQFLEPLEELEGDDEDGDAEMVEEAEEIPDLMLLTKESATPEVQADMWHWAVAQLICLMSSFSRELMLEAHNTDDEEVRGGGLGD